MHSYLIKIILVTICFISTSIGVLAPSSVINLSADLLALMLPTPTFTSSLSRLA